jgi:hypothetical protein
MAPMNKWSAVAFSMVALVACDKGKGGGAGGGATLAEKDGADGLKAVFQASQAACTKKDFKTGKAIVTSILPAQEQLKKIFKDDVTDAKLDEVTAGYKDLPADDEKVACIFSPPGRTDIKVHASSVEDLVAYKEGTPSFEEFPGGARRLAETVLKPGQMFYEVEVTEPGKDTGTKFHMFFWDGAHWRMLGPAWRAFN